MNKVNSEYKDAREKYLQRYHDGLECCALSEKDTCTNQVAEYYFSSSGETRAICTLHIEDAPCMYGNGIPY